MVSTVLTKLQLRESYSHCHTVIRQLGFATRARDATSAILFVKIALREFDDIYVVPSLQNGLVCKIGVWFAKRHGPRPICKSGDPTNEVCKNLAA